MNLSDLQARALTIAALYDQHHTSAGRATWSTGDLALGFVGDVGDLAKLIMAVDGRRVIPDAEARLGHELADCLWSVLVLAGRYHVDLVDEFARMTDGIERHLRAAENPAAGRTEASTGAWAEAGPTGTQAEARPTGTQPEENPAGARAE